LAVVVHPQPPGLDTSTVDVPPAAATFTAVVETSNVHSRAGCDSVNVLPAIVIVPVRAAPVFAAAA
jgi:hypothetical protein